MGTTSSILLPGTLFAPCELLSFLHRYLPHGTDHVFFSLSQAYTKAALSARQNVPNVVLALSYKKTHLQSKISNVGYIDFNMETEPAHNYIDMIRLR
jgi:hypothetical protein